MWQGLIAQATDLIPNSTSFITSGLAIILATLSTVITILWAKTQSDAKKLEDTNALRITCLEKDLTNCHKYRDEIQEKLEIEHQRRDEASVKVASLTIEVKWLTEEVARLRELLNARG